MKKEKYVTIEWEPAAECFMVDFFFPTAPPGHEEFHMAVGAKELQDLYKEIQLAFRRVRKKK